MSSIDSFFSLLIKKNERFGKLLLTRFSDQESDLLVKIMKQASYITYVRTYIWKTGYI